MTVLGGGKIKLLLMGVTFWAVKDIGESLLMSLFTFLLISIRLT